MSNKYCPVGKIECGRYEERRGGCFPILNIWEQCPWPSKQKPVKKSLTDRVHTSFVHMMGPLAPDHSVVEMVVSGVVEMPEECPDWFIDRYCELSNDTKNGMCSLSEDDCFCQAWREYRQKQLEAQCHE